MNTYEVCWSWFTHNISSTTGAGLLAWVSIEPLAKAGVAEGVAAGDGVRFVEWADAYSTDYDRSKVIEARLEGL